MTLLTSAGLSANFVKCQYSIAKSRFVNCRNTISLALNHLKVFLQKRISTHMISLSKILLNTN